MANTDPDNWFLDAADVAPRDRFTSENLVEPLIDGEAYMTHLADRMAAIGGGEYFHISGWRVTPTQMLRPLSVGSPNFLDQVIGLVSSQAQVRAMIWFAIIGSGSGSGSGATHPAENTAFVNGVNAAGGTAILDDRLRHFVFSSHHQKTIVLSAAGTNWGYVGGIDICADRWDRPAHDNPPGRTPELFQAWHDVQVALRGGAVTQIWQNFTDRWNDPTAPHSIPFAPGGTVPPAIPGPPPAGASFGTHNVQLLRTLACGSIYSFLPGGEQTIRMAYERAIDRAQHYVYIEDQYFWPCAKDPGSSAPGTTPTGAGVIAKLRDAVARGVKVIVVMAHEYDQALLRPFHNQMRQDAIDLIRSGNPVGTDNVFTFHLQQPLLGPDIYVHAKLMIIDDCYAVVGTPNFGRRSQTNDSELSVAVVDDTTVSGTMDGVPVTVCKFAKDLRVALWQEHLGVGSAVIDDPIAGLAAWPSQAASTVATPDQRNHAVWHFVPTPRSAIGGPGAFMNVETNCP